jgi:hypothetical protein
MTPKEDPAEVAARLRERRLSALDQENATQKQASGLTSDLRSIYGPSLFSMFSK